MLATVAVSLAALSGAAQPGFAQSAKDGRPEVRVAGTCNGGATAKLRLRGDSGEIELEFEIEHARPGALWRVALVHERRVAWKGSARTTRSSGSFAIGKLLSDLPGFDTVTARAWGPNGLACRATATLADDS
jgi:hypothetical protein